MATNKPKENLIAIVIWAIIGLAMIWLIRDLNPIVMNRHANQRIDAQEQRIEQLEHQLKQTGHGQ